MRNKKFNLPFLAPLLMLCAFMLAGNVIANAANVDLPLQRGDYLSVEYIDLLNTTHSPIAAGEQSDQRRYCNISFDTNDKKIYFGISNFHDSEAILVSDQSISKVSNVVSKSPIKLKLLSRSAFTIKMEGKTLTYHYVGNLKQYIARNTLAGKYRDSNGALYSFTEEGLATFPDRSFRYEVPTDLIVGFDQLLEIPQNHDGIRYGFKFANKELHLFKIEGEMFDELEPTPFIILMRIDDPEAKHL